jgi:hypothetical protein
MLVCRFGSRDWAFTAVARNGRRSWDQLRLSAAVATQIYVYGCGDWDSRCLCIDRSFSVSSLRQQPIVFRLHAVRLVVDTICQAGTSLASRCRLTHSHSTSATRLCAEAALTSTTLRIGRGTARRCHRGHARVYAAALTHMSQQSAVRRPDAVAAASARVNWLAVQLRGVWVKVCVGYSL